MTEEDVRELLREMRDEPVPADTLARVRLTVAERTKARHWPRSLRAAWAGVALLVAAACFGVLSLAPRKPAPSSEPGPPAVARERPPAPRNPVLPAVKPVRRARPKPAAQPPVLIRIETPDPDVVILLIGE